MLSKVALASLIFTSTSLYAGSNTSELCDEDPLDNYQVCSTQLGWYIGGEVGTAKTDVSQTQLDTFYSESGLNATSTDIDNKGISGSLFFGYQFNRYFALEAGYLNLGDRSIDFTGQSSDLNAYYDSAEHIYPQSAYGFSISALMSLPLSDSFRITGKLGYFDWKGDYITYENQTKVGKDQVSDQDFYYGLELGYRISDSVEFHVGYQHFELTRDKINSLGLGIRYYFAR